MIIIFIIKNLHNLINEFVIEDTGIEHINKKSQITLNGIDYTFKNFNKFDYEFLSSNDGFGSTITFENCKLITSDLSKYKLVKYRFINCGVIESIIISNYVQILGNVPKLQRKPGILYNYYEPTYQNISKKYKNNSSKYQHKQYNFNKCSDFIKLIQLINQAYRDQSYKYVFEIKQPNLVCVKYCAIYYKNELQCAISLNHEFPVNPIVLNNLLTLYKTERINENIHLIIDY